MIHFKIERFVSSGTAQTLSRPSRAKRSLSRKNPSGISMSAGETPGSGDPSWRVVGVSVGESHTLALTGDGRVYSWGRGTLGRLGTGDEEDVPSPEPVVFDDSSEGAKRPGFVGVAAGAYHSLALDDEGSVWTWGYNIYGQLGYSGENSPVPRLMDCFLELGTPNSPREDSHTENENTPLKITTVKAGGMMSLAIDSLGALWMWGNCPNKGDAEEFCLASSPSPLPIWDFHGHTVVKVTCGNEHVIALVTYGETFSGGDDNLSCYSWGNNNHGQLGLGDNISRARPSIISAFDRTFSWAIYEISCGAFHTAVLARNEIGETMCWTFGFGENGQLGIGTTNNAYSPEPVESLPREAMLVSIDCGLFHTCVVSDDGCVWSWGMEKGLGLCPDATSQAGDALSPLRIKPGGIDRSPQFVLPIEVGCGAAHTVLVDDRGYKLWAWGRGRSGVLGTGQTEDSFVPCLVAWPPSLGDGGQRARGVEAEEVVLLQAKLERMERYAGLLHLCLFGKGFDERDLSRLSNDGFDMRKELEELMETSNDGELARMDAFYRSMHREVKERLMQRRIEGIVKDCLASLSIGDRSSMG